MVKKKKKVKKKSRKKASRSNVVKIQVEAKAPKKRKKSSKKKPTKKRSKVSTEKVQIQMQPILVDNFVALQKVMVNLAGKMDNLNSQLSELLNLFELSAKSLAKKGFKLDSSEESTEVNKEILNKLGDLSEQNKVIAKGLTMIHEAPPVVPTAPAPMPVPRPMPKAPVAQEEYKKSAPAPKAAKPKPAVKK